MKGDADQSDSTVPTSELEQETVLLKRIASPVLRITELLDSDSETDDSPQIVLDERTPEESEARTPGARTLETTPTLSAMPANLQFARLPVQVDLSAG